MFAPTPVRVPLSVVATPAFSLLDISTGLAPDLYNSADSIVEVVVYGNQGFIVDMSTATAVEVDIIDDPAQGNVLASATMLASDPNFRANVAEYDWQTGVDQQAILTLKAEDLLTIDMLGLSSRTLWMAFHAALNDGRSVPLGTGPVTLRAGIPPFVQLPLLPVPDVIPAGCVYRVPAGVTVTASQSPTVDGALILEPGDGSKPQGTMIVLQP